MASQVSPGVVIRERDLTNTTIVNAQALRAAIAAAFQKGPVETPTTINSQKEFVDVFGGPVDANAEDWFVASEFLNYGGRLVVSRSVGDNAEVASSAGNEVSAANPGSWGNNFAVVAVDRGFDQIITLASAPAVVTDGTTLTFAGGKTAKLYDWNGTTRTGNILNLTGGAVTTSNALDIPDTGVIAGIDTLTGTSAPIGGRVDGTYNAVSASSTSGSAATFNVVITAGVAVVTLVSGGTGYLDDGVLTISSTQLPQIGSTSVTFQVNGVQSGVISAIDTFTGTGAPAGGRVDGSYPGISASSTGGSAATFNVVITAGVVAVTLVAGGTGYLDNQVLTISSTQLPQIGSTSVTFQVNGIVNTTIAVSAVDDWYRNASVTVGTFSVKLTQIGPRPGTSPQGVDLGFSKDEFHIGVVEISTGRVVETYQYLSKLQNGKSSEGLNTYYRSTVNQRSVLIQLAVNPFNIQIGSGTDWTDGTNDNVESVAPGALGIIGFEKFDLVGGDDDNYASRNDALEIFRSYDATDLDFILMGGSGTTQSDTLAKGSTALSIASGRKDCVAFISSHKSNQLTTGDVPLAALECKNNILNFFAGFPSTSYAVFDSGYKYLYDRFNDVYRWIPCNGDVAGLCVATSAQLADWYSPAGLNRGSLRNAVKLAYNPSQSDRDELYSERINPVISLRGSGITLFGDKTALSSPSAFDRINVRRLFLNIERRVDNLAQGVLFEQNDTITRSGFSNAVNSYLAEIRADRGLTDFLVVCDESNNTPSVIDRNEFVADIYLQPTRSINFITITLTATRTGINFQEVVGG